MKTEGLVTFFCFTRIKADCAFKWPLLRCKVENNNGKLKPQLHFDIVNKYGQD